MKWSSERYARLYTRDTSNWVAGPWQARAVLPLVLRKLDRAGTLDLDDNGLEGLAAMIGLPVEVVEPGMAWWAKKGTLVMVGSVLTMPNYVEAQEVETRRRIPASVRQLVILRDGLRCGLCGTDVPADDVHIDHVTPWALGGSDAPENLQVAHSRCNLSKGARVQ